MKILSLVAITVTVDDELVPAVEDRKRDEAAMLRTLVTERVLDIGIPASCTWCEEAESEKFRAGEGHDDECPFQALVVVDNYEVQWALPVVPVKVIGVDEDHDTAGVDTVAACSRCGGTAFRYEEGEAVIHAMLENYGHTVVLEGDVDRTDPGGDDLPGMICLGCEAVVEGFGDGDTVAVDFT